MVYVHIRLVLSSVCCLIITFCGSHYEKCLFKYTEILPPDEIVQIKNKSDIFRISARNIE